jgi:hypothetical protein
MDELAASSLWDGTPTTRDGTFIDATDHHFALISLSFYTLLDDIREEELRHQHWLSDIHARLIRAGLPVTTPSHNESPPNGPSLNHATNVGGPHSSFVPPPLSNSGEVAPNTNFVEGPITTITTLTEGSDLSTAEEGSITKTTLDEGVNFTTNEEGAYYTDKEEAVDFTLLLAAAFTFTHKQLGSGFFFYLESLANQLLQSSVSDPIYSFGRPPPAPNWHVIPRPPPAPNWLHHLPRICIGIQRNNTTIIGGFGFYPLLELLTQHHCSHLKISWLMLLLFGSFSTLYWFVLWRQTLIGYLFYCQEATLS